MRISRGAAVTGFDQDGDGVTAAVGSERVRARYLIGADGAHSAVRKALGCAFEGGSFEEHYMLGDVEVDWSLPAVTRCAPPTRSTARPTTCW